MTIALTIASKAQIPNHSVEDIHYDGKTGTRHKGVNPWYKEQIP